MFKASRSGPIKTQSHVSGWIKGRKQRERSGPRWPHTEKLSAALTEGDAPHHVFIPDAVAAAGLVLGGILFYMLSLISSCTKYL